MVFPISLVIRTPAVLPKTLCKLIVSSEASSPPRIPVEENVEDEDYEDGEEDDEEYENEDIDDSTRFVAQEIMNFIGGLRSRGFLEDSQAELLGELLIESG